MSTTAGPPLPGESRTFPFQVRGSVQTMLSLKLLAPQDPAFFSLLVDKIAHAPDFFRAAPLVLDVSAITAQPPIDLAELVERLQHHKLKAIGIQNGNATWNEAAEKVGLALFGAGGPAHQRTAERAATTAKAAAAPQSPRGASLVVTEPVRGGQQISTDGDLTVLAPVGHGAELAAAGHIHVYGPLRGRAFAGINGDESAMIFCDSMHAGLLSIAGI